MACLFFHIFCSDFELSLRSYADVFVGMRICLVDCTHVKGLFEFVVKKMKNDMMASYFKNEEILNWSFIDFGRKDYS